MRRFGAILLPLCMLLFIQCGSRATMVRKYYLIESDARIDVGLLAVPEPFLVNAYFSPVHIAEPYQDLRIALRNDSHELVYYYYHFWADKPAEMATSAIANAFAQAQIFKNCSRQSSAQADVMVGAEIQVLERVRTEKNDIARVAGVFKMTYLPTNTTMLTYEFDRQVRLRKDKSMNSFAQVLSKAFFDETEEFIFRVADYYQYPPE
jgi:ABC-type uncharacterized transport system auxiliary subunit